MTEPRHTADTITDDALDALYAELGRERMAATTLSDAEVRATQLGELLNIAHETSNRSEAERAQAARRAERAEAAVARVRALHRVVTFRREQICAECSAYDGTTSTDNPPTPWPCDTITAIVGTEGTNSPNDPDNHTED